MRPYNRWATLEGVIAEIEAQPVKLLAGDAFVQRQTLKQLTLSG